MAMWKNYEEMFQLMKEKLYTPVVGDILDQVQPVRQRHFRMPSQRSYGSDRAICE